MRFRQELVEQNVMTEEEIDALQAQADQIIADAVEYAKAQPQPRVEDLERDVYAD